MSEDIDKHIHRKYDIQTKLGKGVRLALAFILNTDHKRIGILRRASNHVLERCPGVRHRLESSRQEDQGDSGTEEDFRCFPE